MPIKVVTLANLINKVNLMLNCTLTMPCVVILSCTPVSSLWNIRNQLYFTIDCLDAFVLIIIPIKLFTVQRDVDIIVLQIKGSQSVIGGTILSIIITKWLKALSAKVAAIEITLCYSTELKKVQQ